MANPKVQSTLKQLSGTWFNPTVGKVLGGSCNQENTVEDEFKDNTFTTPLNDKLGR